VDPGIAQIHEDARRERGDREHVEERRPRAEEPPRDGPHAEEEEGGISRAK
jgi:hypothetical protein